jgi:hypothetical protein
MIVEADEGSWGPKRIDLLQAQEILIVIDLDH